MLKPQTQQQNIKSFFVMTFLVFGMFIVGLRLVNLIESFFSADEVELYDQAQAASPATPANTPSPGNNAAQAKKDTSANKSDGLKIEKPKNDEGPQEILKGINLYNLTEEQAQVLVDLNHRKEELDAKEKQVSEDEERAKYLVKRLQDNLSKTQTLLDKILKIAKKFFTKKDKKHIQMEEELGKIYANMDPIKAAKVFNDMSLEVAVPIFKHMDRKKASLIFQNMDPGKVQEITTVLTEEPDHVG